MSETRKDFTTAVVKNEAQAIELIEKLFTVTQPETIFGKLTEIAGRTIFTASEVNVCLGVGFGMGNALESINEEENEPGEAGMGGGGVGGGGAQGRPIAVISVSEAGVEVEPVVDATKIALAFFTMLGSIFFMGSKMKKATKG